MKDSVENRLKLKELELSALYDITTAITANASEDNLYKIFKFTIASNPSINNLLLFVRESSDWVCKVSYGVSKVSQEWILLDELKGISSAATLDEELSNRMEGLSSILPIKHKEEVLAYVLLGKKGGSDVDYFDMEFVEALANITIVAIENKKLARKEQKQEQYRKQLEIAKDVQTLLFPKALPKDDVMAIKASYLPHHTIGGDYFDYFKLDEDRFFLSIADVSGKGIPAAILMSNFQGGLRMLLKNNHDLEISVQKLNELIIENANGENFITAFFFIYNLKSKTIHYVNAGHNPPFLFLQNDMKRLETGTTILGGFNQLPFLQVGEISNVDDFFLFCFTDGFTETYNDLEEEFGETQLGEFLEVNKHLSHDDLHQTLIAHLNTFKGNQAYADDITLLSYSVTTV
ncbi:PP2C family protein-serine/threonine phosphatase [Sediminitomix flava]|uniref:Sigma-B regulation protein RsbU (Phosphoserine phosphatase) n=1 Tax=Sediminitomix flava TaxID=379075 RepID=A0A315ZBD3_SEDFL|nr:PP2C family protein-serine/threonine phosphatase [Sediminitomix flava]PWJ42373.1 sigma-B regulation protein RsbU (phosphoserine phosphatase) [Sediminitomix flava]